MLRNICSRYEALRPKLVILFGSYARGDYTNESNINVLAVSDQLPKDPRQAYQELFNPEEPM